MKQPCLTLYSYSFEYGSNEYSGKQTPYFSDKNELKSSLLIERMSVYVLFSDNKSSIRRLAKLNAIFRSSSARLSISYNGNCKSEYIEFLLITDKGKFSQSDEFVSNAEIPA